MNWFKNWICIKYIKALQRRIVILENIIKRQHRDTEQIVFELTDLLLRSKNES